MKRIAVDLAKSVFQVAGSIHAGQVAQRRRLSREAFVGYIQQRPEPVERLMEVCGTAHYCGEFCRYVDIRVRQIYARYVESTGCTTRRIAATATPSSKQVGALTYMRYR